MNIKIDQSYQQNSQKLQQTSPQKTQLPQIPVNKHHFIWNTPGWLPSQPEEVLPAEKQIIYRITNEEQLVALTPQPPVVGTRHKPNPSQTNQRTSRLFQESARVELCRTRMKVDNKPLPYTSSFPPDGEIFVFNINVNLFSFPWRCCFLGAAWKNFTPHPTSHRPNRALQLALLRSRYTAKCNQRAMKCTVLL